MPKIRWNIGSALKSTETRRVCWAHENLMATISALDTLPLPVLQALREYVADEAKDRTGALSEFLRAFVAHLEEPLRAALERDREEPLGMFREYVPLPERRS
jgi:hypothetical protein